VILASGDGCTKTLFGLGSIDPGFIQETLISLKKLAKYLIFMPNNGKANLSSQMIMSSVLMKRPVSRPEFASIPLLLHVLERG